MTKLPNHTQIPFTISPTNHFLIEGKLNDSFARFILDTGAGRCCMGLSKAIDMDLVMAESEHTAAGVGDGYMDRFEVVVPQMRIGDWGIENFMVAGLDLSAVNQALGSVGERAVYGIIGADILLEYGVVLDYQERELMIEGKKQPFERMVSNHIVVEVDLSEEIENARFIVDTGAGQTCMDIQKAELLGWTLKEMEEKATGIGSTKMPISTSMVSKMGFGDFGIFEYSMTIIDLAHVNEAFAEVNAKEVDAIVGADILWQYDGVIDCQSKILYLKEL